MALAIMLIFTLSDIRVQADNDSAQSAQETQDVELTQETPEVTIVPDEVVTVEPTSEAAQETTGAVQQETTSGAAQTTSAATEPTSAAAVEPTSAAAVEPTSGAATEPTSAAAVEPTSGAAAQTTSAATEPTSSGAAIEPTSSGAVTEPTSSGAAVEPTAAVSMVSALTGLQADNDAGVRIDLTDYLSQKTTMQVSLTDKDGYYYTLEELRAKNLTVPEEAPVTVKLYFDDIYNLHLKDTMYYQIDPEMISHVSGTAGTLLENDS
jgi:hypothetical protein